MNGKRRKPDRLISKEENLESRPTKYSSLPWTLAGLTAIAVIAAIFRLYKLTTLPPGLYLDEVLSAQHAIAWRLASHKEWFHATPLFEPGQAETSNVYLAWASGMMALFGDGFVAARMLSVLPSLLCVPLLYVLARIVTGPREAMLAALLLAMSHWAAWTGRDGWDQVAMTALQLAALAILAYGIRRDHLLWTLFGGLVLGACLYTYVASRLVFAQIAVWLGWEVLASPKKRRMGTHAALCLLVAIVCAAPYYHYLATESAGGVNARVNQLALGSADVLPLVGRNIIAHLTMFNFRGGTYARDNLPGWPMLDPITGIFFLIGLALVIFRRGWQRRLLITWFGICVLGGVLSQSREGPPYVYRVANLAPWACLVGAVGLIALWDRLRPFAPRPLALIGALMLLVAAGSINYWILFEKGSTCPDFGLAFGASETQVGLWLSRNPSARPCYVHYGAVRTLDEYRSTLWYPETNGYNWYRPQDSAAAIQLTANLYRSEPRRALNPVELNGDIDLVRRLPDHLSAPAVFVVPSSLVERIGQFYVVEKREDLVDNLGRHLATTLRVRPR